MARSWQYYPNNHVDVPCESTMNITLSMGRASGDNPEISPMPHVSACGFESVLPIRSARPGLPNVTVPTQFSCGSMEAMENEDPDGCSVPVKQESEGLPVLSRPSDFIKPFKQEEESTFDWGIRLPTPTGPFKFTSARGTVHKPSTVASRPPPSNESGVMSPPPVKVEAEDTSVLKDL